MTASIIHRIKTLLPPWIRPHHGGVPVVIGLLCTPALAWEEWAEASDTGEVFLVDEEPSEDMFSLDPDGPLFGSCLELLPEGSPLYRYRSEGFFSLEGGAFEEIEEGVVFNEPLPGTVALTLSGNTFLVGADKGGEHLGYVYPPSEPDDVGPPVGTIPLYQFTGFSGEVLLTTDGDAGVGYPYVEIVGYVASGAVLSAVMTQNSCLAEPAYECLLALSLAYPEDEIGSLDQGDLNQDGHVDESDVEMFDGVLMGEVDLPCMNLADMDGDGKVDSKDESELINETSIQKAWREHLEGFTSPKEWHTTMETMALANAQHNVTRILDPYDTRVFSVSSDPVFLPWVQLPQYEVLVVSGLHANEVVADEFTTLWAQSVSVPEGVVVHFMPFVNLRGRLSMESDAHGNRGRRKNMRFYKDQYEDDKARLQAAVRKTYGVDLNRNFATSGWIETPNLPNPDNLNSAYWSGPAAASEDEARMVQDFIEERSKHGKLVMVIDIHTGAADNGAYIERNNRLATALKEVSETGKLPTLEERSLEEACKKEPSEGGAERYEGVLAQYAHQKELCAGLIELDDSFFGDEVGGLPDPELRVKADALKSKLRNDMDLLLTAATKCGSKEGSP